MKYTLYFYFLLFPALVQAQTWSKIYVFPNGSSDLSTNVKSINDGGFVIAGGNSGHLTKVDANGFIVFRQYFEDISQAIDVVELRDGGFGILAFQGTLIAQDIFEMQLIRTDDQGKELWRKQLEVDPGNVSLLGTQQNGFAIQGSRSAKRDFVFYILEESGEILYQTNNGVGSRFTQLKNGGFIFARNFSLGITYPENADLVYLDAQGELVWQREVEGIRAVQQLSSGELIVSSNFESNGQVKALSKYDLEGNFIWRKTYPQLQGVYYQRIMNRLLVNERDEIAFSTLVEGKPLLAKFDSEGNLLCAEIYSLKGYEGVFEGLDGTQDFGFIINGRANQSGSLLDRNDLFLIRTDSLCKTKELEIINIIEPEVEVPLIEFSFKYYPNPSSGLVNFEVQANESIFDNLRLTFFDMLGRVVHTQPITMADSEINLINLPSGAYRFELYEGNRKVGDGKVILAKL